MKLYIARHGEAISGGDEDSSRPLSEKGNRDVNQMGKYLAQEKRVVTSQIFHSGFVRAQQTAEIYTPLVCPEGSSKKIEGITPMDSVEGISKECAQWEGDTFLVSHLPLVSHLTSYLLTGSEFLKHFSFSPGTVACLLKKEDKQWKLEWLIQPHQIPHSF